MGYRPPPGLVHLLASNLVASLRFHLYDSANVMRAARLSPTGTAVFCLWHQSLLAVLAPHQGFKVAALASLSGDGQIIADYMRRVGVRPVRGSSARGGVHAAKELMEALRDGYQLAIAVDGPRGPFKRAKTGPLEMARRNRIPLVPIAVRATRELTLKKSWDRFRVPLPRAHLAVVYGEPIVYPEGEPTAEELEKRAKGLSEELERLEERATRLVGKYR